LTDDELQARRTLQFREAEGLKPLPDQLKLSEVSLQVRVRLWDLFRRDIEARGTGAYLNLNDPWCSILRDHHLIILERFSEDYSPIWFALKEDLKKLFAKGGHGDLFEFVQFVLRHKACPNDLYGEVAAILQTSHSPYRLVDSPPTLVPVVSMDEIHAVERALVGTNNPTFGAARSHLLNAAACLTAGDAAGTIRESIHAVESVAKVIAGDAGTTLAPALKIIEKKGGSIHPALRIAFEKLYGYASDQNGIRHAAIDPADKSIGEAEALFMYTACAGFVSYLVNKADRVTT
jgi:hypothetical protein